jgi:hypothetical protein
VDYFEIALQEVGWNGVDRINVASYVHKWWAVVNMVMNIQLPLNGGNFLTS